MQGGHAGQPESEGRGDTLGKMSHPSDEQEEGHTCQCDSEERGEDTLVTEVIRVMSKKSRGGRTGQG